MTVLDGYTTILLHSVAAFFATANSAVSRSGPQEQ
jgi:hypothetical protein